MADPNLYGVDLFGDPIEESYGGELAAEFLVPPFSVLNAREGWWQSRKRAWLSLGIRSEVGRGETLADNNPDAYQRSYAACPGGSPRPAADYSRRERGQGNGRAFTACRPHQSKDAHPGRDGGEYNGGDAWLASGAETGTSVFDPVLCELVYRWFCPPGGQVVDPFAGGSVRGIVAARLGLRYWGSELRAEQIAANEEQRGIIDDGPSVVWQCGDARDCLPDAPPADLVFSCPPYGDLERYSDDPRDLSTYDYPAFMDALTAIIAAAAARLQDNRFAALVVGDFRCPAGFLRGFVADTIGAGAAAGLRLYNHMILVTAAGSLPIRAAGQFRASRKIGKTHQDVLVFVKGDPRRAAASCAEKKPPGR